MQEINKLMPSNKKFGFFFSFIFSCSFLYTFFYEHEFWYQAFLILAVITFFTALFFPKLLYPVNKLWFLFGLLLGKIISPIVLGAMFFLMITPISLVLRIFGRDELKLKKTNIKSYWVTRSNVLIESESFRNQF